MEHDVFALFSAVGSLQLWGRNVFPTLEIGFKNVELMLLSLTRLF
jgi:hypothetical protein